MNAYELKAAKASFRNENPKLYPKCKEDLNDVALLRFMIYLPKPNRNDFGDIDGEDYMAYKLAMESSEMGIYKDKYVLSGCTKNGETEFLNWVISNYFPEFLA